MAMTYKTVTGQITQPGTNVGIRAKVTATPLTTNAMLVFEGDDRISVGPQTALTDSAGNLGTLKIPTNVDVGELYWHISAESIDTVAGVPKRWTLKSAVEVTGTGTVNLRDLAEIDTTAVDAQIIANLSELVQDAEAAAAQAQTAVGTIGTAVTDAQAAATSAGGSASTASTAATTATTKAGEATTAASTATTKASEATTAATTATTKAGEASTSAGTAATARTAAESARTGAETARTGAETAQTAAAGSATTASGHATTATTKASEASSSASTADTHRQAAEDARDAAVLAKNAAETKAGEASDSAASIVGDRAAAEAAANTATTKASEATDAATLAGQHKDAAHQSALDAAQSASEAAAGGVQKVNGLSPDGAGNVTITAGDIGAATSSQGALADSAVQPGDLATVATTGAYGDLSGKPSLAPVATSGSASDITTGTLPTSVLPPLAINETFTVANQAAMLALPAQRGDMAIRSDNGRTYVLSSDSPSTLADWKEVMAAGQVQSVAGKTGVVSLTPSDVGAATAAQGTKADTAVQPGSLAAVATSGAYSSLSGTPTLGDAAAKNTGTAAGTVAAGNDSRIVNAARKEAHVTGLATTGTVTIDASNGDGLYESATLTGNITLSVSNVPGTGTLIVEYASTQAASAKTVTVPIQPMNETSATFTPTAGKAFSVFVEYASGVAKRAWTSVAK